MTQQQIKVDKDSKGPSSEGVKRSTEASYRDRIFWLLDTLFHQSFAVVGVFILWTLLYYNKLNNAFTWHTVLSTVAYVPLMGEAIVLFSNDNLWSQRIERTKKYVIHGCLQFTSAVLVTVGIALMIDEKTSGHFVSIHAWTGLVSWIFVLTSQFLGVASSKTQLLPEFVRPVYVKFSHNLLGQLGYVFGIVSLAYGLYTRSFKSRTSDEARLAAVWVLGITTFWSLLTALHSGYKQLKTILT